ncbi:MAG: hypothetical protein OHK0045_19980 [Raineya sp.]
MFIQWIIRGALVLVGVVVAILFWELTKRQILGGNEPKIEVNHNVTLEQIEAMGKLELVKFKFKDILEYRVKKPWYSPDSKAIVIISGESVGCIDLTKIRQEHIVEKEEVVYIQLPEPELCYTKVNHQETRLYEVSTGIFSNDEGRIVSETYKEAEKQLERTALESNILEQTKTNAELVLKPTLERIARKKVVFRYDLAGMKIRRETKRVQK